MDRYRGFDVNLLCGAGGAELSGIDASRPLNAEINRIIQSPDGREQMLKFGLLATGSTPDELTDVIRRDTPRWGEVIRKGNIKAQ